MAILQGLGLVQDSTEKQPKISFSLKKNKINKKIFLLVMPKYGGKQNFSLVSFPEVGQKQKTQKKEEIRTESESQ